MRTAEVRVEDFVAVQEVGKVINPVLAAGQIEGGVAQGIGFALYENVVWQEGRMVNGQMTNYIMPTSMDVPPIRVFFEEIPYGRGPARRERHRRAAAGRHRARRSRTPSRTPRGVGRARNSRHAGSAAGNAGGRACLSRVAQNSRAVRSEWQSGRRFEAYPMARLLDVLREESDLTGTKEGCGEGECGACSIEMDGALVNSCLVPALQADGAKIRTIEGVASGGSLHAVQQAFLTHGGAQCGICTPGMIFAAVNLLARHPQPIERANS